MKRLLLIVLLAGWLQVSGQNKEALKKIEAAKIALITERMNLTPQQAEKFWPIYREYSNQQREIRREFSKQRKSFDPNTATEAENKRILEMGKEVKQRQLNLEKEYSQRVLNVISARQLNSLQKAESDFKDMLLKRIRSQQQRKRQHMNDKRLQNRRN